MNQFFFHPIITSCLQHKAKGIKERKDSNFHHQWHPHGHFKLEYHLLNYFFDPFNSLRLFIKKIISSLTIHIMHSNYIYSIQSLQHRAKKSQSMKKNSLWMIPISSTTSSSKATILIQTLQYNNKKKGGKCEKRVKLWSPWRLPTRSFQALKSNSRQYQSQLKQFIPKQTNSMQHPPKKKSKWGERTEKRRDELWSHGRGSRGSSRAWSPTQEGGRHCGSFYWLQPVHSSSNSASCSSDTRMMIREWWSDDNMYRERQMVFIELDLILF